MGVCKRQKHRLPQMSQDGHDDGDGTINAMFTSPGFSVMNACTWVTDADCKLGLAFLAKTLHNVAVPTTASQFLLALADATDVLASTHVLSWAAVQDDDWSTMFANVFWRLRVCLATAHDVINTDDDLDEEATRILRVLQQSASATVFPLVLKIWMRAQPSHTAALSHLRPLLDQLYPGVDMDEGDNDGNGDVRTTEVGGTQSDNDDDHGAQHADAEGGDESDGPRSV